MIRLPFGLRLRLFSHHLPSLKLAYPLKIGAPWKFGDSELGKHPTWRVQTCCLTSREGIPTDSWRTTIASGGLWGWSWGRSNLGKAYHLKGVEIPRCLSKKKIGILWNPIYTPNSFNSFQFRFACPISVCYFRSCFWDTFTHPFMTHKRISL